MTNLSIFKRAIFWFCFHCFHLADLPPSPDADLMLMYRWICCALNMQLFLTLPVWKFPGAAFRSQISGYLLLNKTSSFSLVHLVPCCR